MAEQELNQEKVEAGNVLRQGIHDHLKKWAEEQKDGGSDD